MRILPAASRRRLGWSMLAAGLWLAGCHARLEPRVVAARVQDGSPEFHVTSYPGEPEQIDVVAASIIRGGVLHRPGHSNGVSPLVTVEPSRIEGRSALRVVAPDRPHSPLRVVLRVRYADMLFHLEVPFAPGQTARWIRGDERCRDLGPWDGL